MEAARALPEGKTIAVAGTAAKQDQKKAKADLQLQVGKAAVKQVSEQTNSNNEGELCSVPVHAQDHEDVRTENCEHPSGNRQ